MNERDELAYVIYDAAEAADYDDGWHQKAADAVHAAGYRRPREVTTAAELDALPVGSVVLDRDGEAWQRRLEPATVPEEQDIDIWDSTGSEDNFYYMGSSLMRNHGPVTLLHEPEGER